MELVDDALAVLRCESNGDPDAYNPYSGASGLFQFLPSTWATVSVRAGFGGASVFDANANTGTAAWLSNYYAWLQSVGAVDLPSLTHNAFPVSGS